MAENDRTPPRGALFFQTFLCVVAATLAVCAAIFIYITHVTDFSFMSESLCRTIPKSSWMDEKTFCFFGTDWDEENYLSAVTDFYTTLISVLIALQALITWISFAVVRNSNRRAIEDEIEKELPKFFDTGRASEQLDRVLRNNRGIASKDDLEQQRRNIQDLRGRVEQLEEQVRFLLSDDDQLEDEPGEADTNLEGDEN